LQIPEDNLQKLEGCRILHADSFFQGIGNIVPACKECLPHYTQIETDNSYCKAIDEIRGTNCNECLPDFSAIKAKGSRQGTSAPSFMDYPEFAVKHCINRILFQKNFNPEYLRSMAQQNPDKNVYCIREETQILLRENEQILSAFGFKTRSSWRKFLPEKYRRVLSYEN
jgi:hypothetical protein